MLSLIPFVASHRVLEFSIVEMFAEDAIHHAEGDILPVSCLKIRFPIQPPQKLPPAPLFMRHLLKHFFDNWRAFGVEKHLLVPLVCILIVEVPQRRRPGTPPLLAPCPPPPPHLHTLFFIFP